MTDRSLTDTAIALRHVHKVFNRQGRHPVEAVRDLDLTVERGEIVALLGPNGAGKTTTLDLILGLDTPTSGNLEVLGQSPRHAITAGRIAAVLQTGGLLGDLTVGETVRMIASLYAHPLPAEEALERAGVRELQHRRVSKCSGGEQQRLRFALALIPQPEVLILDEPTAGMDVNARREFWATMSQEATEGRTIVFATHYLHEVETSAERVVMLTQGVIVADGSLERVRALGGRRTVTARWPEASAEDLARFPAPQERVGDRLVWHTDDSDGLARQLFQHTPATDLEIQAAGLDDVFASLTDGTLMEEAAS